MSTYIYNIIYMIMSAVNKYLNEIYINIWITISMGKPRAYVI